MHPCCNGSLQKGTKIIAIVHLGLSALFFLIGLFISHLLMSEGDTEVGSSVRYVVIFSGLLGLLFGGMLLYGANKRNRSAVMIWFIINTFALGMVVMGTLLAAASGEAANNIISTILGIGVQIYCLWVVWAFLNELREESALEPQRTCGQP